MLIPNYAILTFCLSVFAFEVVVGLVEVL